MPAPKLATFEVDVDGTPVTFTGPADLTDDAARERARQELAISSGKIPTSFGAGFKRGLGDEMIKTADKPSTHAGMTAIGALSGVLTANPKVGQAAMTVLPTLTKESLQYVGHKLNDTEDPRDGYAHALDVVKNVAPDAALAYGPGVAGRVVTGLASKGSGFAGLWKPAQAVAGGLEKLGEDTNASALLPERWMPAARRGLERAGSAVSSAVDAGTDYLARVGTGVTKEDLTLLKALTDNGMKRAAAIKIIGQNDPAMMAALDRLTSSTRPLLSRIGSVFTDESGAAIPAVAAGSAGAGGLPPSKVGNTSSSAELLERQRRAAIKSNLQNRIGGTNAAP